MALTWTRSIEWDTDDWRKSAACRDTDPDLFFPVGTTGQAIVQIEEARAVCLSCEVREPCLEFALATNQESGVWGGTSEEERRKLRRVWSAASGSVPGSVPGSVSGSVPGSVSGSVSGAAASGSRATF